MKIRISYPLSTQTTPEYRAAIDKVRKKQTDNDAKVVDVEIAEIEPGQFAGIIVLEVEV